MSTCVLAYMLKFISAVIAAAAIAGGLTLLSATSTRLNAKPLAKPQATALKADRLTPSAVSDAQSILFETSQIQDW
jgi:hypothetical protein